MKRFLIFLSLIVLLGGVIFFLTLDFKEQEEVVTGSIEQEKKDRPGSSQKDDLNSLQNKSNPSEGKEGQKNERLKADNDSDDDETESKEVEGSNRITSEFELDPQYYPSLGGYLKVDGKDIQSLEIFFRKTESFIISLSFTKVTNSIFQVENSFWNLHQNPDGKSYNLRIGSGPLSGNIVTFTPKREPGDIDATPIEEEQDSDEQAESEDQPPYDNEPLNNEQEDLPVNEEENSSSNEAYESTGNSTFE